MIAHTQTVVVIGAGVIGQGWAVSFAEHGWSVRIVDVVPAAAEAGAQAAAAVLAGRVKDGGDIAMSPSLAQAIIGAALIVEAVPENLAIKQDVLREIEAVVADDLPIVSSTSALLPSDIAATLRHPARFVVAHPFNPSYLIPLVELVPGRLTSPATTAAVKTMLDAIGKRVVELHREIEGFVGNRLQAAVINEAIHLVREGVASATDIDACISECLAMRWAFFGPFETMDQNAPNGFADYATKFGNSYAELGRKLVVGDSWQAATIAAIETALQAKLNGASRSDIYARRDAALERLAALKSEMAGVAANNRNAVRAAEPV